MKSRITPLVFLLLLTPPLLWAGNAVLARSLVGEFPPLALSFWRWTLALAILLPFNALAVWRFRPVIRAHLFDLTFIAILGVGCYNSFQYLALQSITALNATLIGASAPVMALLVGSILFRSAIRRTQGVGAVISLAGVLVVIAHGDVHRVVDLRLAPGDLWMLSATFVWSIYTWLLRTRRPPLPFAPFLTVQVAIGALSVLPFYLLELASGHGGVRWTSAIGWSLAYVAAFPSVVAYICWDRGVARAGAVLPMYFLNLTPVFAALISIPYLGESVSWFHLAGGALILLGIHFAGRAAPVSSMRGEDNETNRPASS